MSKRLAEAGSWRQHEREGREGNEILDFEDS